MSVSRSVGDLNGVFHHKKNAQGKANVIKVEPKIIYACNKCSYKSSLKEELRAHKVDKHNIVLPPEMQQNVRKNEPKTNYACTQCSYLSGDKDELRAHKLTKHAATSQLARDIKSEPKSSYACTDCSFLSADKNELRAHKATKHEKPALIKNEFNSSSSSRIKEAEAPTHVFACNKCSYKSVQKDELLAHKQVKHQIALPQDAKMKSVSAQPSANQKRASGNIWNMNKEDGLVANVFKTFKVDSDANDQIKFSKDNPSASDAAELENLAAELENSLPPTNKDTINKSTKLGKNTKASNEDFECKICMVTFWYKTQMESHMKDVHGTSEKKIESEVYKTPKAESEQNLVSNQLSTSSRNYNHRTTAKSTTDYRRCCQLCNFSADRQEFDMHLKSTRHIQKVENNSKNKNLNQTDQPRRNMSQAGKGEAQGTESNDQLNKAAPKRSLPETSDGPNKSLKLEQSNVQKQNPTNSEIKIIYACNKCSYKSEIKAELRAHKVSQHEVVPLPQKPVIFTPPPLQNQEDDDDDSVDYSCKVGSCMQSFWYENDLYAHMANVHD